MAFSMSGVSAAFSAAAPASAASAPSAPTLREGGPLPEIGPDGLGFKGLNADQKANVLPRPWPANAQPPSYASLLSIASAHGIYAAGGPDGVVIGTTQAARDCIYGKGGADHQGACPPLHTIPCARPVLVAFAADESCLVVAHEESSEIVAYATAALLSKNSTPAVTLSANAPLRALVPNPEPSQAHYVALVTTNGHLLIADLKKRQLLPAANGPVLADQVSCVTWSNKGKHLIAGRGDGSAIQLLPDGSIKAHFAKPASVPDHCHLAQVVWLENNVFFFNYTPTSPASSQDAASVQYLVRADKERTTVDLSKADQDIFFAVIDRLPAHFFAARLRNYAPHLDEVLFLSSSVAPEIAMITKASKPLDPNVHPEENAYTITKPMDDGRWAALPVATDGGHDTTPIGMAIDLSDQLSILKPIPSDSDIEDSSFPLPELVALNSEGMLVYWAFVYDDAVRSKQPYPGFDELKHIPKSAAFDKPDNTTSLSGPTDSARQPTSAPSLSAPNTNLQSPSVASVPSPAISKPAEKPVFGTGSAFAQPAPINQESRSSWASTGFGGKPQPQGSTFGQPATFGSPSSLGQGTSKSAFGTPSGLGGGAKPSFGQSGFSSGPSFGQTSSPFGAQQTPSSSFAAKPSTTSSPFASAGTTSGSGFSSFASQGGFSAANKDTKGQSPFSAFGSGGSFSGAEAASPFASAAPSSQTPFGQPGGQSAFGKPTPIAGVSPFGQSKGFRLESSFQKDETSKDDDDERTDTGGSSFGFSTGLGNMFDSNSRKPAPASAKADEMADDDGSATEVESASKTQKTPPSTITQPKSTTTPHVSSLFGTSQPSTTPQTQPKGSLSTNWSFGHLPSTTPKATPAPAQSIFGTQPIDNDTPAAVQRSEPNRPFSFTSISNQSSAMDKVKSLSSDDGSEPVKVPDAPLPPDPFSKPGFQTGDTSTSSLNSKTSREPEDAPLPPDFVPANKTASQSIRTQDSEIPSELLSDDFEESGEDVTGEVSPVEDRDSSRWNEEDRHENVETSPESSFGHATDRSPVASPIGGAFTNVTVEPSKPPARPLFGEFGGTQGPIFPPPKPQHSPRSPSPMRKPPRQGMLVRSPERSFSAPAQPRSLIAQRRQEHQQSPFAAQAAQIEQQEAEKARLRREAERWAQKAAEAAQFQPLEDDEDALLREELSKPTQPSANLDPFMAIQPGKALQELDAGQNDVPSQIEVLYQDINSMIVTLGINAKSLSAYIMYQTRQAPNTDWPDVLRSETPMDALNDEWVFGDIERLPEGHTAIASLLADVEVHDVMQKLEECQNLLVKEVSDLRNRITALRRSTHARMQTDNNQHAHAPLSAEQASIQHDLRKASASVLTDLAQVEEQLVILRAKLADLAPSKASSDQQSMFGFMSGAQKRPSVEAVMNTVSKMTAMAEKRSADVDVIEAQLKKLNVASRHDGVDTPATPERRISRRAPATPASAGSSVYHTPDSNGARSVRSTPARGGHLMVSAEDKEKWQSKAAKKRQISRLLKTILGEENGKARA